MLPSHCSCPSSNYLHKLSYRFLKSENSKSLDAVPNSLGFPDLLWSHNSKNFEINKAKIDIFWNLSFPWSMDGSGWSHYTTFLKLDSEHPQLHSSALFAKSQTQENYDVFASMWDTVTHAAVWAFFAAPNLYFELDSLILWSCSYWFSKFAGIGAAFPQHHLKDTEIFKLWFCHLHQLCSCGAF